jgi:hypothetical protein
MVSLSPVAPLLHLETLALRRVLSEPHGINGFLDILTLPALRRLQVSEVFLGPDPIAALSSLIHRKRKLRSFGPLSNVIYPSGIGWLEAIIVGSN